MQPPLFNRQGQPRRPNSGPQTYSYRPPCPSCGGRDRGRFTPCPDCRGTGRGHTISERLYTAERLAALTSPAATPAPRSVDRRRAAAAGHLAEPGLRLKTRALVIRCQFIREVHTFPRIERWLVQLQTEAGHLLTWWTSRAWDIGEAFEEVALTVAKHDHFDGLPQTTVQRVTFKP